MSAPGLQDRFDGAVAVVTGASRGLGAGIAARLAEHGFSLGLCARTEPTPPVDADGRCVTAAVDVTDPAAVDAFAADVATRLGPIDLWINNAGVLGPIAPARDADPGAVRDAYLVNVIGVHNGSAAFARATRTWPAERRVLVNITSGAARSVYEGWSTYGPSKAAVDHLSRHLAAEEPQIVVRAVAPGVVDTDMQAHIRSSDPDAFPSLPRFREIHRSGEWNSPGWIADHIAAILAGTWGTDDVVVRVPDEPHPS